MFEQTLKSAQNLSKDIAGFDMNYEEFKKICRKAWKDGFIYFSFDTTKTKLKAFTAL